ncbi:prephenate dehydrogenase (NADP(+)) [Malassezia cuniculi]|uniref:Prephenate dehydrogenase (NADP(+)) n=1 Tax=Malassezia cuniculi TaxID=948313 RepID=A0AAF0EVT6_9BASI|nr:prephenate dehydrogenase (NADP(+)) [Malassezia cuniculi]
MGDMGRLYAARMRADGWEHVNVCDRPENFDALRKDLSGTGIHVFSDGHQVARRSDFCMFAVEVVNMDRVVAEYGPSMKVGAIVSGQSSVKAPEKEAFDKHLPDDVHIISCHSLHGPNVDPTGQPLVLIRYKATDEKMQLAERILGALHSRFVYMSYEEHDTITANTQATTHAAFLSMGTAWSMEKQYPWETGMYPGGIETVKINLCLRIYGAKWHVYAGLAILNPAAKIQVTQYATSATDLFKMMVSGDYDALVARVFAARRAVFGWKDDEDGEHEASAPRRKPILMSDSMLDRFHMAAVAASPGMDDEQQPSRTIPNSHLSLLAIADSWNVLGIDPYHHLELAATPIFRLWIGVTEYLFRSPTRLLAACRAALDHKMYRADDTEFVVAARGWAQAVQFGDYDAYFKRFESTRQFFEPRLAEANRVGAEMLKVLAAP